MLDTLKSKEIIIEKKAECLLSCYHITNENIKELLDDGDVIFSESSPRELPKKYVVEIETKEGEELKLIFELSILNAKIISVDAPGMADCNCE